MARIAFLLFIPLLVLFARENPFIPTTDTNVSITSNIVQPLAPLSSHKVSFPSTARTLEQIVVYFKNLDGSVEQRVVPIQKSIDWHKPLVITQQQLSSPITSKIRKKSTKRSHYKRQLLAKLSFIRFYVHATTLRIYTQDKLLRDFMLVKPNRIVCDFKRNVSFAKIVKKGSTKSIFTQVVFGKHKGYYRAVIYLDGYYRYKLTHRKEYYEIKVY